MEFETKIKEMDVWLCKQSFFDEGRRRLDLKEESVHFSHPAYGYIEEVQTVAGSFFVNHVRAHLSRPLDIEMRVDEGAVQMNFFTSGGRNMPCHDLRYLSGFTLQGQVPATKVPFEFLSVAIPKRTYFSLMRSLDIENPRPYFSILPDKSRLPDIFRPATQMSAAMMSVVRDMYACKRDGHFRRLFLEAKVTELIVLQHEQLIALADFHTRISTIDIEKMHQARSLILENLTSPLSLADIARQVGTNEFKLKKQFKEIFGTTVFGYLNELRMNDACRKLQEAELNVKQVAELMGFKTPNHFNSAFKRHFGYTPGKVLKK